MNAYEDIKATGLELNELYELSPTTYHYIKGYIHHAIAQKSESESIAKKMKSKPKAVNSGS